MTSRVWLAPAGAVALLAGCIPGVDRTEPEPQRRFAGSGGRSGPPPDFGAVVTSDRPPPPISGGTLRALADGRTAVASDPDRDKIFVADLVAEKVLATIDLDPGSEPGRIAEDGEGRVHVVLRRAGAVVTLAPKTFEVAGRRSVCAAPRGIAYEKSRQQLHVACAGGELLSLAPEPTVAEPLRRLQLERDLRDVVVQNDRLFVSRFRSAEVLVLASDGRIESRLRPADRSIVRNNAGGAGPVAALATAGAAWRIVPYASGDVLVLHQSAAPDAEVSTEPGGYGGGGCTSLVESVLSRVGSSRDAGLTLGAAPLTVDVAVSPDQKRIAVAVPGNAHSSGMPQVQVLAADQVVSARNPMVCVSGAGGANAGRPSTGDAGVGGSNGSSAPDPGELPPGMFEARQPRGQTVALDFTPNGNLVVQTREPATLQVLTLAGRQVVLSYESRADTGHAVFHANAGSGLACASCHPEGGEDGRVWVFQKLGPRRTQSLRGGVIKTAPFHWDGGLKDLSHLMKEVFETRMGGPSLLPEQHQALQKWLDQIPAAASVPPRDAAAVERGRTLYFNATVACASCHNGALLTDNRTLDVGTGRTFQVPSLRGVAMRAPYMHDGCAATLKDRFRGAARCGGGDKHGVTSKLTDQQLDDLIAFLETL